MVGTVGSAEAALLLQGAGNHPAVYHPGEDSCLPLGMTCGVPRHRTAGEALVEDAAVGSEGVDVAEGPH